jgi:ABC-2 type transport system ATP-binding protein
MIDVEGLAKTYASGRKSGARALDGVTFRVPDRSIFGFLGPNGAGKTTTIRILTTILEPTSGRAAIGGHDIRTAPLAVKGTIGYMPEYPGFYPTMNAAEHLDYWGRFYRMSKPDRRQRSKELLELVGLNEHWDKKVKAYSHGMHKRLGLAQALLHDPPVLILDEPAGGLDPHGIIFFRNLMRQLNRDGKTIFLSSHILSEVQQTCTHLGIIHRGKIVAQGTAEEIQARLGGTATKALVEARDIPEAIVADLRDRPHVTDVVRTDWGLIVSMDADVRTDVNGYLVAQGVLVQGLKLAETTLEDAFLALTGGPPT